MLADLFDDDEDVLTVVRAPSGLRHQSGVIPLVDDRNEAIVEEAPPSTLRTEQLCEETSHVRTTTPVVEFDDDEEEHEPIGANAFSSGTIVMDLVPPTPTEKLGKKTLRVSKDELFANSAKVEWQEPVSESPPTAAELFVDEVSQGGLTPLPQPLPVHEPTISELPPSPQAMTPVVIEPGAPSSALHRRRDAIVRARVAGVICVLAALAGIAIMVWQGWV